MSGLPRKKPGGDVGKKIYTRRDDSSDDDDNDDYEDGETRQDNTSDHNGAADNGDTAMTGVSPGDTKPTIHRVIRSSTKRKLSTDADALKVQSKVQRKRKKIEDTTMNTSVTANSRTQHQPKTTNLDGQGPSNNASSVKYKTVADFVESYEIPKKSRMRLSPVMEWDEEANRPSVMVRVSYGSKDGEKGVESYTKQTAIPKLTDRLLPMIPHGKSSSTIEISPGTATIALPQTSVEEIQYLLKKVNSKLNLVSTLQSDYLDADFKADGHEHLDRNPEPQKQSTSTGLNDTAPPFSNITDIFSDIARKAENLGFLKACEPFGKHGLRVVTMCSGTESPLLALDLLKRAFGDKSHLLNIEHVASAEIEPFKQAYIQRNFQPKLLFRDVTEFCDQDAKPHTAYGGTADQPDDIHMLVAGSSCIDYSLLNNKRKVFGEKGQSFSTLRGITSYCIRTQPAVVILENVDDAPWSQILDLYQDVGYTGLVLKVDTKDFYIPQTRNRRYMVAFNTRKANQKGFVLKDMFETVVKSLQMFKQRATVPYTHFLYSDDDPELSIARHKITAAAKNSRQFVRNWTACQHRYAAYRVEKQVGSRRPYTEWRADGSCRPVDLTWIDWMKVQRERIWDTMDISFLCYLRLRDYDMSHKCRWLELSQNVDRDLDVRSWGITNCLTPSGIPMESRRGGPVTGRESLALQGIPADKLLLNKETSAQLQDMAGNAMTTTVVGSVIFSAIIASLKKTAFAKSGTLKEDDSIFEPFLSDNKPEKNAIYGNKTLEDIQSQSSRWILQDVPSKQLHYQPPAMKELRQKAASAMQLCRCEGALGKSNSKISVCLPCGTTFCATCRGNPIHVSAQVMNLERALLSSRTTAQDFHKYVQEHFPPAVDVLPPQNKVSLVKQYITNLRVKIGDGGVLRKGFTKALECEQYLEAISESLQHTLTLTGIKREKIIRVVYESSAARLEFRVQFDRTKSLSDQETWSGGLVSCTWLLFAKPQDNLEAGSPVRQALESPVLAMEPKDHLLDSEFQFSAFEEQKLVLNISVRGTPETAWESTLGIEHPDFQNVQKWPELQVEVTQFKSDCQSIASSINGLYRSLSSCGGANGTLHVKMTPSKLGQDSPRSLHSSSMFLFLDPAPFRNATLDSMVFSNLHERLPHGVARIVQASIAAPWRPVHLSDEGTSVHAVTDQVWKPSRLFLSASEQATTTHIIQSKDPNIEISSVVCDQYFSIAACRLPKSAHLSATFPVGRCLKMDVIEQPEALKALQWLLKSKWRFLDLETWHQIKVQSDNLWSHASNCVCNPVPPKLKWRLATASKRDTMIIKPFEDVVDATKHEQALKNIPQPVKAFLHCHNHSLVLDLQLNLDSVVHRVVTSLSRGQPAGLDLCWRLARDTGLESNPSFPTINAPGYGSADPLIGRTVGLKSSCRLNVWQEQSAYWIEQQELAEKPWFEVERLECRLPALQQRLDVEGKKKVHISGGILADAVGSGKTLTSMIIPACEALSGVKADDDCDLKHGLICLKATLFLIPSTLFAQ